MLLNQKLKLYRFFKITWKIDLLMIAFCISAYVLDNYVLTSVKLPVTFPALLGTALAFFIGFNNNQAYNRWWEARIIWGAIVNDSRSWARNLLAYTNNQELAQKMILRHLAFLYALTSALRKNSDRDYIQYLSPEEVITVEKYKNIPNAILDLQAHDLHTLRQISATDDFSFLSLNNLLQAFCDSMGKSERINSTVFPTTYVYFTWLFIWLFIALITMATSYEAGMFSVVLGWFIGFVFHITHLNGMSLMNPFEGKPAGIPISSITRNIEINLLQTIQAEDIPKSLEPINDEYIL